MTKIRRSPLRETRELCGLTVTQLAEKSGVSRRIIVWAEHLAINSISRCKAERLAQALGKPLAKLFPPRKKTKVSYHDWAAECDKILIDDKIGSLIELTLRGGHQIALSIPGWESERLYDAVQRDEDDIIGFISFDCGHYQYALNPKHLVACSFSDYPIDTEDDPADGCKARLWLATSPEMVEFDVNQALGTPGDPESCDENWLYNAMIDLDAGHQIARVGIIDVDDKTTWVRVDDIAMIGADRCALYPEMRDAEEELEELDNKDVITEKAHAAKSGRGVSNDFQVGETEHDADSD